MGIYINGVLFTFAKAEVCLSDDDNYGCGGCVHCVTKRLRDRKTRYTVKPV